MTSIKIAPYELSLSNNNDNYLFLDFENVKREIVPKQYKQFTQKTNKIREAIGYLFGNKFIPEFIETEIVSDSSTFCRLLEKSFQLLKEIWEKPIPRYDIKIENELLNNWDQNIFIVPISENYNCLTLLYNSVPPERIIDFRKIQKGYMNKIKECPKGKYILLNPSYNFKPPTGLDREIKIVNFEFEQSDIVGDLLVLANGETFPDDPKFKLPPKTQKLIIKFQGYKFKEFYDFTYSEYTKTDI